MPHPPPLIDRIELCLARMAKAGMGVRAIYLSPQHMDRFDRQIDRYGPPLLKRRNIRSAPERTFRNIPVRPNVSPSKPSCIYSNHGVARAIPNPKPEPIP